MKLLFILMLLSSVLSHAMVIKCQTERVVAKCLVTVCAGSGSTASFYEGTRGDGTWRVVDIGAGYGESYCPFFIYHNNPVIFTARGSFKFQVRDLEYCALKNFALFCEISGPKIRLEEPDGESVDFPGDNLVITVKDGYKLDFKSGADEK